MKRDEELYKAHRSKDLWLNVAFLIALNVAAIIFASYLPFSLRVSAVAMGMVNAFHILGCGIILICSSKISIKFGPWSVLYALRILPFITLALTPLFSYLADRMLN